MDLYLESHVKDNREACFRNIFPACQGQMVRTCQQPLQKNLHRRGCLNKIPAQSNREGDRKGNMPQIRTKEDIADTQIEKKNVYTFPCNPKKGQVETIVI